MNKAKSEGRVDLSTRLCFERARNEWLEMDFWAINLWLLCSWIFIFVLFFFFNVCLCSFGVSVFILLL